MKAETLIMILILSLQNKDSLSDKKKRYEKLFKNNKGHFSVVIYLFFFISIQNNINLFSLKKTLFGPSDHLTVKDEM